MSDYPILPAGFRFGASTASYQIEGGVDEGGRGSTIWDTFCAEPGRIADGSSGAVTCDHYHRYAEDIALMRRLGLGGYRLSMAWSRLQPTGRGPINPAGVDFYDRLLDSLLEAGVAPMVTLYHWDLPQALEDDGGWLTSDTARRFAEYAALAAEHFGDRVERWVPVNEPNVASVLGYAIGVHAPGRALGFEALAAAHHLNLAHGLAVQALRAGGVTGEVGTANNHTPVRVATDADADRDAARLYDDLWNRLFADPMLLRRYPESLAPLLPATAADDLDVIGAPLDFYGVNYYYPTLVRAEGGDPATRDGQPLPEGIGLEFQRIEGVPRTDFDWPVVPDGLREVLVQVHERYPDLPPVHVTENGCSDATAPDADGVVDDQRRIAYLDGHLRAVADAIAEGVDVRGYYTWSLLDNFEWAEGFGQRFGLVWVDYDTLARTPKASFDWYAGLVSATAGRGGRAASVARPPAP